ncbi:unnamed protein product [Cercopithifilaria johnstoni]|uniref:Uncharacterized protein n=1 Tax=Cercopithifilaria johnstoni TaxID=2874296 RepID=A0A8J2PYR3_9BILA|nr:unnamed protein product [Cercopithifilaria johnstoni]
MLIKKRTVLKMSDKELEAAIKVISPDRLLQKYSKSDLQEELIHWILENGLRVSHEFTVIEMDDGSNNVNTNINECNCCQRLVLSSVNQDEEEEEEDIKKKSENNLPPEMVSPILVKETNDIQTEANVNFHPTLSSQHVSEQAIISTQPLPTTLSLNDTTTTISEDSKTNPKEHIKQQKDELSHFCTELGSCCVSLLSKC